MLRNYVQVRGSHRDEAGRWRPNKAIPISFQAVAVVSVIQLPPRGVRAGEGDREGRRSGEVDWEGAARWGGREVISLYTRVVGWALLGRGWAGMWAT